MAGERPARTEREQPEAVAETGQHLLDGEQRQPPGRQFESEWDAVEPTAELAYRVVRGVTRGAGGAVRRAARGIADRIAGVGRGGTRGHPYAPVSRGVRRARCRRRRARRQNRRARLSRPLGEQRHRVRLAHRRQREHGLARHPQRAAAGREHGEPGGVREQLPHQGRAALHQVLEPVEHQQEPSLGEMLDQYLARGPQRVVGQPERLDQGVCHQLGVAQRRELGDPHLVAVAFLRRRGSPQCESRLADPTHPDHRDQARLFEESCQFGLLGGPSDEPVQLRREIAPSHGTRSVLIRTLSVQSVLATPVPRAVMRYGGTVRAR